MTSRDLWIRDGFGRAREYLDQLTDRVTAHHTDGQCKYPQGCPGTELMDWIGGHPGIAGAVLAVALCDRSAAATYDHARLIDSIAGTLLACNADIVIDDDGQGAHLVDEPKWRGQAQLVADELLRVGIVGR